MAHGVIVIRERDYKMEHYFVEFRAGCAVCICGLRFYKLQEAGNHYDENFGGCHVCGEKFGLAPDHGGYYFHSRLWDGAPLVCTNGKHEI